MSSQELFNDLLALRVSFEDHTDETFIIRELKMFLISRNVPSDNINQIIIDFYQSYDINFENEFIESIHIPPPFHPMFMSNLSNLINSVNSNNLDNQIIEEMESDSDESNEEFLDNSESTFQQVLDNSENNLEENESENTLEQVLDNSENQFESYIESIYPPFPPISHFNHTNQLNFLNVNNNNYNQFFSALNGMISSIPINTGNTMEDVKVTLEENEIENFKEYVLEEDKDTKCSICMMQFKKGDNLLELKCEHSFHKDCISHYLKEYSYKCPICRKECGKAKFHV